MTGGFPDDYKFVRFGGRRRLGGPRQVSDSRRRVAIALMRLIVVGGELFLGGFQGSPEAGSRYKADGAVWLLVSHHGKVANVTSRESL